MPWEVIGILVYVRASGWFVTRQQRWTERVIQEINTTRPPHDQFDGGWLGVGPLRQWDLIEAMWQHDPRGCTRMFLTAVALALFGAIFMIRVALLVKQ